MGVTNHQPDPGLCGHCRHVRRIHNKRGSTFHLCQLAKTDDRFRRYPRLPVLECEGYQRDGEAERMLKPIDNPPNPFESAHVEWLGEPPKTGLEVYEEEARSILSENDSPDIPFRYSLNPYRGCSHACAYCYARPSHEYLGFGAGSDFETRIVAKVNAPDLLKRRFESRSWQGERIVLSGDTDCYQPLEASYELTRRVLELCLEYRNPVTIITKSRLILRDVELLAELAENACSRVQVSLPFYDRALSAALETGTAAPAQRLKVLDQLTDAGVPCGIIVAPLIPGLNDVDLPSLLEAAAEAGAWNASLVLLRLPGSVEQVFTKRLEAAFPNKADKVLNRLKEMRGDRLNDPRFHHRMRGSGPQWQATRKLFEMLRRRHGLTRDFPEAEPTFDRPGPKQLELF